ncbi:hypothetical protein CANCADRAFT_4532 [Tortispora caseinolytica NRRL Y-17796]|uniref:Non-structural maintenance of chromosomes element 4 n=1 Tax=Tortispora caseinolytica NRRL Y-17796 TaxID=767744 RepID=A0A1E4T9E5_9ASCO|nr:hypothetical protein CANCADRAFT_4532 [Tortispora caseinolytica NRRL Y-17796]
MADDTFTVRSQYRELQNTLSNNKDEVIREGDSSELNRALKRANDLFGEVGDVHTARLDAQVLLQVSETAEAASKRLKLRESDAINLSEVIEALKSFTSEERWNELGDMAFASFKFVPTESFLVGNIQNLKKRARKAAEETEAAESEVEDTAVRRIDLGESVQAATNDTSTAVKDMYKHIAEAEQARKSGLLLFEVILNPESYSQSVENMFHLSFLIHEGKVRITTHDDNDLPYVSTCAYNEDEIESDLHLNQSIFRLDMETWQALINQHNIKSCILPTRETTVTGDVDNRSWN